MNIEDKVSGTGLIQTLRREHIPITAVQRDKDKISRGNDAAPFIESGGVYLPLTRRGCPTSSPSPNRSPQARTTTSSRRSSQPTKANPMPVVSHFAKRG
jgi:hypothetical protein